MPDHLISEIEHWLLIAGTAVDAVLLLRLVGLRLHRVYTFVALYCAVTLLFDGAAFVTGIETPQSEHLYLYSRFLLAVVVPLAIWDLFQEAGNTVRNFRNALAMRLASTFVILFIFVAVAAALFSSPDSPPDAALTLSSILVWATTISGTLVFLFTVRRIAKQGTEPLTGNTQVLWLFFVITLFEEAVECLFPFSGISKEGSVLFELVLSVVDMGVVLWCALKLRGLGPKKEAEQSA